MLTSILVMSFNGHHIQVLEATGLNCTKRVLVYVLDIISSVSVLSLFGMICLINVDFTGLNSFRSYNQAY